MWRVFHGIEHHGVARLGAFPMAKMVHLGGVQRESSSQLEPLLSSGEASILRLCVQQILGRVEKAWSYHH